VEAGVLAKGRRVVMNRGQAGDVVTFSGGHSRAGAGRGRSDAESVVLVVSGDAAVLAGLAAALVPPDVRERVVTAGSGLEAIHQAFGRSPISLLVIDRVLPGLNGAMVARAIRALQPQAQVIMLIGEADDDAVVAALGAGADAVFTRTGSPADFARLVLDVRRGDPLARALLLERPGVAARVMALVQARTSAEAVGAPDLRGLTARELAVVDGVVQGMTNREIGARLQLTEQSVKNYMTVVLRKLQLSDRRHVLQLATQEGWTRRSHDLADPVTDHDTATVG
jgi:DNA-binding NarL/FixJ family response regulator